MEINFVRVLLALLDGIVKLKVFRSKTIRRLYDLIVFALGTPLTQTRRNLLLPEVKPCALRPYRSELGMDSLTCIMLRHEHVAVFEIVPRIEANPG
jgi:hypothetical protein